MTPFEKALDEASTAFVDQTFKDNTSGFTVADYVNREYPGTCFEVGAAWARSFTLHHDPLVQGLREALKKNTTHYQCDDPWYSCPLSGEGSIDDREKKKCNCGASEARAALAAFDKGVGE